MVAAIIATRRRYARFGGDPELVDHVGIWAVVAGLAGARLAHVATNLHIYREHPLEVFAVWRGGLAFFGGLSAGAITAIVLIRRAGGDLPAFADAGAVGVPLAQAIGRWGNYFNQELFGTPTDLPWALEVPREHRPPGYTAYETFHPTFLYESLWNVVVVIGLLVVAERRGWLSRGSFFLGYLVLYGTGRFGLELIRTDTTFRFLGLSRNAWVALGLVLFGSIVLVLRERHVRSRRPSGPVGLLA